MLTLHGGQFIRGNSVVILDVCVSGEIRKVLFYASMLTVDFSNRHWIELVELSVWGEERVQTTAPRC